MADLSRLSRKRLRRRVAASVVSAALILGAAGCSLLDWDNEDEIPAGYRTSSPTARQPRQTAADRGRVYLEENRLGLAIDAYLLALINEGRTVEILNGLGVAYDLLGRFDLARQYYREALSIDSDSVRTLNNLGRSYALERNYVEAVRYYELAMTLDPSNEIVLSNLSEARAVAPRPPRMHADALDPGGRQNAEPRLPWVQVAGPGVQTLVTHADPLLIDALRKSEVKPQLAAPALLVLDEGRPGDAMPTMTAARHASVEPKAADRGADQPATVDGTGRFAAYVPVTIKSAVAASAVKIESPAAVETAIELSPASLSRGAGRYRVQLAALRSSDDAERTRVKLRNAQGDVLDRVDLTIERADLGPERGVYFRIQTTPFGAEEDAKNLCRSIANRGQSCFVVRT